MRLSSLLSICDPKGFAFRVLFISLISFTLAACGFQLRQQYGIQSSLQSLEVNCPKENWRLCQRLRNQFQINGIDIVDGAPFILNVSSIKSRTRALTITPDASVAENEINQSLSYQLSHTPTESIISEHQVNVSRRFLHDNKELLSQERQTEELHISLQEQLADQVLNLLSIIDPLKLSQANEKASQTQHAD